MDYRLLNQETLPQAMELWDACFEKKGTPFYEWYFSSYCLKQNKVLGAFRDGRLAAMLHLNPYTLHVRGRDWRVPYIVGVATDPLDRGRHLMGELMDKAFTMLRAMQIPFVILMPIHAGIYQPYGFAYTHMRKRYELPLSSLSFGEAALAGGRIRSPLPGAENSDGAAASGAVRRGLPSVSVRHGPGDGPVLSGGAQVSPGRVSADH